MKFIFTAFTFFIFSSGCSVNNGVNEISGIEDADMIYHYSVLKALDNGVLEGDLKIEDLKKYGNFGLGTFNKMDGEMIVYDSKVYRISQDGNVGEPPGETLIPYTVVSFFNVDDTLKLDGDIDYTALKNFVDRRIPSKNTFYAFLIQGEFDYIKCGGASIQNPPYNQSLQEMLATRPIYEKSNIKGVLVGFWCPEFIGDINTQGFHLHFLASDHSTGGHLIDFKARSLNLGYDIKSRYQIILPETEMFRNASFRDAEVNY